MDKYFQSQGHLNAGPIADYLRALHDSLRGLRDGQVADYIPELGRADPEDFAISIATVDGAVYSVGCAEHRFTIQSVSKPFMLAYAIETHGIEAVLDKVGVEPTGDPFNSIILDEANNRPFNPMVNAGAIATTELIRGDTLAAQQAEQMAFFSRFAARALDLDTAVYRSESDTGHRNRAIAYMMLNSGMIEGAPEDILDIYFRQCSILVNTADLAVMAAVLAAHGRNPLSKERVLRPGTVRDVLSVMATCGMYDYAGQWMFDVGLPAKSGVSGGIMAVLPGQFGIAVYSPRLDSVGNSVRGIEVCKRLSRDFSLHAYVDRSDTRSVIRNQYRGDEVRSNRVRGRRETDVLNAAGQAIAIIEAQGPLFFGTAERLIRRSAAYCQDAQVAIIDLRRVAYADAAARSLLREFVQQQGAQGCRVVFTDLAENPNIAGFEEAFAAQVAAGHCGFAADIDRALEQAENDILAAAGASHGSERLSLADLELFHGLDREDLAALEGSISSYRFEAGEQILRAGDPAQLIFMVARGTVSVHVGAAADRGRRIASIGPGQAFGEMALLDGGHRSADVWADTAVLAYGISVQELQRISVQRPQILMRVYGNIIRALSGRLRCANDHIRALY